MQYDLAVAYRIYPRVSKVPLIFADDKYSLAELCLKSFKASLGDLRAKMWVLLDSCPSEYDDLFRRYFKPEDLELIHLSGIGNQLAFNEQISILVNQDKADLVYFAEDDYFYLPHQFAQMIDLLTQNNDVDFVSPYDHLDYYFSGFHQHQISLKVFQGRYWRTANSTCLTFLTSKSTLKKTRKVFASFANGNYDASLWLSLTKFHLFNPIRAMRFLINNPFWLKLILNAWYYCWRQILFGRRWKLWVPMPAIATHTDSDYLAPTVDWQSIIQTENNS